MGIIAVILVFLLLVIIHELGHFRAAKSSDVHVKEFGIGIPPKVTTLATDKAGTDYTVNLIPLGGFVRLQGENPHDTAEFNHPRSFAHTSLSNKLLILLGGILMNLLAAWLCFTIVFMSRATPLAIIPDTQQLSEQSFLFPSMSYATAQGILTQDTDQQLTIAGILSGSLADQAGIITGSTITHINNQPVTWDTISQYLDTLQNKTFALGWTTPSGEIRTSSLTCPSDNCLLGIQGSGGYSIQGYNRTLRQAAGMSIQEILTQSRLTYTLLGDLIRNLFSGQKDKINQSVQQLSGPVGATKIGSELYKIGGRVYIIAFAGMISLALALFNLLPIPALDGGRIVTTLIQHIGGVSAQDFAKKESIINFIFFVILMGVGIAIMFKDYYQLRS